MSVERTDHGRPLVDTARPSVDQDTGGPRRRPGQAIGDVDRTVSPAIRELGRCRDGAPLPSPAAPALPCPRARAREAPDTAAPGPLRPASDARAGDTAPPAGDTAARPALRD